MLKWITQVQPVSQHRKRCRKPFERMVDKKLVASTVNSREKRRERRKTNVTMSSHEKEKEEKKDIDQRKSRSSGGSRKNSKVLAETCQDA